MNAQARNRLETAVAELTHELTDEQIREAFVMRTAEDRFAEIGFIALSDRNVGAMPDAYIAWTGYQWAIGCRYLGM